MLKKTVQSPSTSQRPGLFGSKVTSICRCKRERERESSGSNPIQKSALNMHGIITEYWRWRWSEGNEIMRWWNKIRALVGRLPTLKENIKLVKVVTRFEYGWLIKIHTHVASVFTGTFLNSLFFLTSASFTTSFLYIPHPPPLHVARVHLRAMNLTWSNSATWATTVAVE